MFGLLCEGSNRVTCEPCTSNDKLSIVYMDSFGESIEKIFCEHCKELIIPKESGAW